MKVKMIQVVKKKIIFRGPYYCCSQNIFDFYDVSYPSVPICPGHPPLRFVRGGVLRRGLMGRRGGPMAVFAILLSNFPGALRSPISYKPYTCIHTSKFNVQFGKVILSLYFPYPNYKKNPTSHPLLFHIFLV